MTAVYITIDTEYSAGLAIRLGLHAREAVYARSIAGHTADGAVGIEHQMEVMSRSWRGVTRCNCIFIRNGWKSPGTPIR